ncbi:hypothetical protein GGTG_13879 [Gaeumannomyces tritici R3-111a-1]|uniref:Uncharacterized protein n=1 Tax=Gaeumannomyces tritici (strain R3-111a-1) TaxID=644352 RepID=J3PK32_GAET3|nr:hypothetical protein GGTG_13879 [Gaeumannomyces tritici R3-111a-1]EJT68548.1 hypothetical protein GGTG_13879 [Gaeumannomyces tritici R3-111a-1]
MEEAVSKVSRATNPAKNHQPGQNSSRNTAFPAGLSMARRAPMATLSENLDSEASVTSRDAVAMLVAAKASHQIDRLSKMRTIFILSSALVVGHRVVRAAGSVIASLQTAFSETGPDMMDMAGIVTST